MKRSVKIYAIFATVLALCSCRDRERDIMPAVAGETIMSGLSSENWTYFSFEKGETVGSSRFNDKEQDMEWAGRTDWDFAICGDRLKTNSGTSGKGAGGVQVNTTDNFNSLKTAPVTGYVKDTMLMVR